MRMGLAWRGAATAASGLALAGCFNVTTLMRVAPDGSGTIEQTLMFNAKNIESAFAGLGFKSTPGSGSSSSASASRRSAGPDEASIRESVKTLGERVSLVSVAPISRPDGYEGVRATFAFDDITKLRSENFLAPGPLRAEMNGSPGDAIRFAMRRTPQGTSVLTITFDKGAQSGKSTSAGKADKSSAPPFGDAEGQAMFKTMLQGARVGFDLELVGTMVSTNADYVDGKRITLVDVNFESLVKDAKKLDNLGAIIGDNTSFEKMRTYLKDVKGLRLNREVVTVEFR